MNADIATRSHSTTRPLRSGYVLIIVLIVTLILSSMGISLASVASSKYLRTMRTIYADKALYAAEAGLSDTISRLNDDPDFNGYAAPISYSGGEANYTTSVNHVSPTQKIVRSIARLSIPNVSGGGAPVISRTVEATVSRAQTVTNYSIYAGGGGITLTANSSILSYNIFSLGKVVMNANSKSIGNDQYVTNLNIGNVACTQSESAVYPAPCPSTQQPLTIGLASEGVVGTVCAQNQTSTAGIRMGSGANGWPRGLGLVESCSPVRNAISIINRSTLSAGQPTYPAANAACDNQSKSPPSGIYNGDVTINSCNGYYWPPFMYIHGNLAVTGTSGAESRTAAAVNNGPQSSVVLVDGTITLDNTQVLPLTADPQNELVTFVSFDSADSSCSQSPSCTELSGTNAQKALKRQQSEARTSVLIRNTPNSNGNPLIAANVVAYYGGAVFDKVPSQLKTIYAQKISVTNGGQIIADSKDPKYFSTLKQVRWTVVNYKRVPN